MYQVDENSTVFGVGTPMGSNTPFRFPDNLSNSFTGLLSQLAIQLYPTGRAFKMIKFGVMDKFHEAVNMSFIRLLRSADSTLDSVFPDNNNFSEEDCSIWEYRYGMVTNESLSVETRRSAILRRMARGRNVPSRQHIKYLEHQLQLAGFDVYVHENGFIESGVLIHKRPQDILDLLPENVQHGGTTQHGIGVQHGGVNSEVIANSYKPNEIYSVGDNNLSKTFFIGGETLGSIAIVQSSRQEEFRELVLKLKPAHLVVFTFIDYV